jgi:hypothetical protein
MTAFARSGFSVVSLERVHERRYGSLTKWSGGSRQCDTRPPRWFPGRFQVRRGHHSLGRGSQLLEPGKHVLDEVLSRAAVADVRPHKMTAFDLGSGP